MGTEAWGAAEKRVDRWEKGTGSWVLRTQDSSGRGVCAQRRRLGNPQGLPAAGDTRVLPLCRTGRPVVRPLLGKLCPSARSMFTPSPPKQFFLDLEKSRDWKHFCFHTTMGSSKTDAISPASMGVARSPAAGVAQSGEGMTLSGENMAGPGGSRCSSPGGI